MIKSVITKEHLDQETEEQIEYPCLMINKDKSFIVNFKGSREGQIVWSNNICANPWGISINWNIKAFTPFNGSITLSNEVE